MLLESLYSEVILLGLFEIRDLSKDVVEDMSKYVFGISKSSYLYCLLIIFSSSFSFFASSFSFFDRLASAQQVVPDNTLDSERAIIEQTSINGLPSDQISGGAIRGKNLFHSFENFSVSSGRGVYFVNPAGVDIILGRVTGNQLSEIQGRLGVLGNADLFLINPSGIFFGPNASLDLNGSFIGSTARGFSFPGDLTFDARSSSPQEILSVNAPIGLFFDQEASPITHQADENGFGLEVSSNQTVALLGGNIDIQGGGFTASSGRVEIGSVSGNSIVSLQGIERGWSLGYDDVQEFHDITLSQALESIGDFGTGPVFLPSFIQEMGNGSNVQLQGRKISLTGGSQIQAAGGNINVFASESVNVIGVGPFSRSGFIGQTNPDLDAANLTIDTKRLVVNGGGIISTGPNIFVTNSGEVVPTGGGGTLTVNASDLVLLEGEGVNFSGSQRSGLLSSAVGSAQAGDLEVSTNKLIVRAGAQVSASTSGEGSGATIFITANSIELDGSTSNGQSPSGIFTQTQGLGDAGSIELNTGALLVKDGAEVSVSSQGSAPAGNLMVTAQSVFLNNSGRLSAESDNGGGGNIILSDVDFLFLNNESQISTTAGGNSTGGSITIDANVIAALPGGNNDITANASEGPGGLITINTQGIFGFQELTLEELQALLPGDPEPTPDKLLSNDITAISQSGDPNLSGQVIFNTPETDPSDRTTELTERIDIPPKLAQRCRPGQALGNGQFANVGNGGLPPTPTSLRSYPAVWHDIRPPAALQQASTDVKIPSAIPAPKTRPIIEANGWLATSKGLMLVAPKQASSTTTLTASGSC
ncbi:two-partner secretion domain-containing protein [Acaryochloris thomasi]|uniref:two-partner secretion domain-containing protein n=1 Tax=Acaryochloris thomasi TaxID=2929456 RepID=UPI001F45A060|nr:filamentous hemagglutinin N-terminal domain-containing protein [Acaryochloris thomasi]